MHRRREDGFTHLLAQLGDLSTMLSSTRLFLALRCSLFYNFTLGRDLGGAHEVSHTQQGKAYRQEACI
jgi:hypothetical protein